jgi:hypothetical protein
MPLSTTSDLVAKFLPVNRSWAKVRSYQLCCKDKFSFNYMVCRSIQQLFFDVSKKKTIKEDAIKNK